MKLCKYFLSLFGSHFVSHDDLLLLRRNVVGG
jgi:hypothetical protein